MKRLPFIDAARGLAIFTVVYSHICLFCLPDYQPSEVIEFLRTYFLNAFFFISGIVSYKSSIQLKGQLLSLFSHKIYQLLIPTFIIGSVFAYSHNIGILQFFTDDAKYGYWFTIVLFEMFVIFYIISYISNITKFKHFEMIILILAGITFYATHKYLRLNAPIRDPFCIIQLTYYIPMFCAGCICKMYKEYLTKLLYSNRWFITIIFAILVISYIVTIPNIIRNFAIVALVFYIIWYFYHHRNSNSSILSTLTGLEILGTNTLEIYFLHYFLLFPFPTLVGSYLKNLSIGPHSLSLPEFIIVTPCVIIICIVCIILARVLKTIPYISLILFGKK